MTFSTLFYLSAFLAVTIGTALLVGAFLGVLAAIGAALIVLSFVLLLSARAVAKAVDSS